MRTPVTLKIKFKSASIDQFIERYSVDVSRGGIFIRTKEPLPVGTQLKFEFQLSDAQPLISGEGTVVWIREHDPTRTGVAPGMGVRFDKLAQQSQQVLDKILTEKQRLDGAGFEGKFDAATRAVSAEQIAKGEIDNRARPGSRLQSDRTPLPDPSPFGGESRPGDDPHGGFGSHESTRVMLSDQAEKLAQQMKEEDHKLPDPPPIASSPKPMATAPRVHRPTPAPVRPKSIPPVVQKKEEPLPSASAVVPKPKEQPMAAAPAPASHQAGGLTVTLAAPPQQQPSAEAKPIEEQPRQATQPYGAAITDDEPPAPAKEPEPVKAEPQFQDVRHEESNGTANGASADAPKKGDWFSDTDDVSDAGAKPVDMARKAVALPPQKERTTRVDPPERRRSSAGAWAAVVLLAAAGGGGYLWWRSTQAEPVVMPPPKPVRLVVAPTPAEPPKPAETPKPPEETAKPPEETPKPAPVAAEKEKPAKPELSIPVSSKPEGAVVAVDGKEIGPAPTKLEGLDAGKTYSVKVTLKGYKPFETKLKAKAGATVAATLIALPKWVAVASTPPGAEVFVDGKRVGATPTTLKAIDFAKSHKIDIKKSGFQDETREVQPGDTWQEKTDHSELALAVDLVKKEKPAVVEKEKPAPVEKEKPVVARKPRKPKEKPAASSEAAGGGTETTEKPTEKPAAEKPAEEKPKETAEKPAEKEKPAAEKPAAEKSEEDLKVPDWMKKK